jgi:hypothetical protein
MSKKKPEAMHHKADGAEVAVAIPHLSPGEKLYVTNVGKMPLDILPKSVFDPILPGETWLFEGPAERRSGDA